MSTRAAIEKKGYVVVIRREGERVLATAYSHRGLAYDRKADGANEQEALAALLKIIESAGPVPSPPQSSGPGAMDSRGFAFPDAPSAI